MKHSIFWIWCTMLMLGLFAGGAEPPADAALPLGDFLNRARHPKTESTYISVFGRAEHRRRGGAIEKAPLYFSLILQPERMTGQILIGADEGYLLGQSRSGGAASSSVVSMENSKPLEKGTLGRMGIDPSDLAMNFLFFEPVRELEPERVKMIPCRVVLMESPDKKEYARVWIARDQYFPLRTEFIKKDSPDQKPYRTLEMEAFSKENDLYYASEAGIYGPGWRTRISFDKPLGIGVYDASLAKNLFRKIGEVQPAP